MRMLIDDKKAKKREYDRLRNLVIPEALPDGWRIIDGTEHYAVSPDGYVRNLKYRRNLKQTPDSNGRPKVALPRGGGGRFLSTGVHVIVCTAFHGPRPAGREVSHLDGNFLNNNATNLAWETESENQQRRRQHGTDDRGYRNSRASITPEQRDAILRRHLRGETQTSIAESFNVSQTTIWRIVRGKRYTP